MKTFALLDENNLVVNVIIADDNFINSLPDKDSYVELTDGGIGWSYNGNNFIPPQPYPSWVLNETTRRWEAPIPYPPDNKRYFWNEESLSWVKPTTE